MKIEDRAQNSEGKRDSKIRSNERQTSVRKDPHETQNAKQRMAHLDPNILKCAFSAKQFNFYNNNTEPAFAKKRGRKINGVDLSKGHTTGRRDDRDVCMQSQCLIMVLLLSICFMELGKLICVSFHVPCVQFCMGPM